MFIWASNGKELFTPILNRIAASVECVSSTLVVLNAKLLD